MARWWGLLAALLAIQGLFWAQVVDRKPLLEIVPAVPSETAVKALSFGDEQAFFRVLGLHLQNFGDTFGRFTALKDYDYPKLLRWFTLLDTLDTRSDYIPFLASNYFSQSQNKPDVRYVVEYLQAHTEGNLDAKWWWRTQAVYLANHKLQNSEWALELAKPLIHTKDVPPWVNQMAAFIYEERGEFDSALKIMEYVGENTDNLTAGELNFMRHFIEERIGALESRENLLNSEQSTQSQGQE